MIAWLSFIIYDLALIIRYIEHKSTSNKNSLIDIVNFGPKVGIR